MPASTPSAHAVRSASPSMARVMGLGDLTLFAVVTGVSLRWIAMAATLGPMALWYWAGAFIGFYIPLVAAVIELSSRHPQEGGLYVWINRAFGPFIAFMAGWSYFTSNLPYFPAVFYFDAGNALWLGGARWQHLAASPAYYLTFALVALGAITALNIAGLRWAKWLHNMGAIGMWLPAAVVVLLALVVWSRHGSVTDFTPALHPLAAWQGAGLEPLLVWSNLAFALSGAEAIGFISGEIRDPRRTIARALPLAGLVIVACYALGTIAVLVIMPGAQVNPLQGLIQAGAIAATQLGLGWLVVPLALLVTLGNLGAASAFLAGTARLPFVIGIERGLPPVIAAVHPRWGTPWVALALQGGLGALFCLLGQAGTGVHGAYDVLVSMGIVAAFLPFAGVFLAMIRLVRADPGATRLPGGPWVALGGAGVGLITTLVALVLAMLPRADDPAPWLAVAKIAGMTVMLLVAGAALYRMGRRGSSHDG